MDSVQVHSASHAAQVSVTNARPDVSGSHSGRTVVLSQPSCCQCSSSRPPPSYEEATRPTQINAAHVSFLLHESQRLLRDSEQELRAREKNCCEVICGNGCCGDLAEICCYLTCYLLLGLLK